MESNLLYFMKNTTELRQGNYILQSHLKTINVVIGIKPSYILTDCKVAEGGWVADSLYQPIHLTEEWLIKFGFVKSIIGVYEKYNKTLHKTFMIPFDKDNEVRLSMPYGNGVMTIAKDIQYVHQLQNLYFALTGEELTIKETV